MTHCGPVVASQQRVSGVRCVGALDTVDAFSPVVGQLGLVVQEKRELLSLPWVHILEREVGVPDGVLVGVVGDGPGIVPDCGRVRILRGPFSPHLLVLEIDPELYSGSKGRTPVNGYTLPSGVEEELSISRRYGKTAIDADRLVDAFGSEFAAFAGQPNEADRETRLGLREARRLQEERPHDITAGGRGDDAIIQSCIEYYENEPTDAILFSNDFGFVDTAREQKLPAIHVDFDIDVSQQLTGSWEEIETLLYMLAVTFGVVVLPMVTLYGIWESKEPHHWQQEALKVEPRSDRIEEILNRDRPIVDTHNQ